VYGYLTARDTTTDSLQLPLLLLPTLLPVPQNDLLIIRPRYQGSTSGSECYSVDAAVMTLQSSLLVQPVHHVAGRGDSMAELMLSDMRPTVRGRVAIVEKTPHPDYFKGIKGQSSSTVVVLGQRKGFHLFRSFGTPRSFRPLLRRL
jgi:hypothetical protein